MLGLFGTEQSPRTSYGLEFGDADRIRKGMIVCRNGIAFSGIDIILNCFDEKTILQQLEGLIGRKSIKVMIHEQYFYSDYFNHQPDFEQKLTATFSYLKDNGYQSAFFEKLI